MRSRLEEMGGWLEIRTAPERAFAIRARLPLRRRSPSSRPGTCSVIRVVLAEDHTLVRDGIRTLLGLVSDIELVGEAPDGEEAMRVVEATKPDVLLLDMRMPKADGLRVVKELSTRGKLPPTLVLTTFDEEDAALAIIAAGARGFLLKDVTLERLVDAVRVVAAGGTVFRPGLSERAEQALVRFSALRVPARRRVPRRKARSRLANAKSSASSSPATRTAKSAAPSSSPKGR